MALPKVDVVIIGVGAAGGVLAKELAVAGLKVVGLERGRRYSREDRMPHDELRVFGRFSLFQDPRTEPLTWRPDDKSAAVRQDPIVIGNEVGGAQVHWGAMSWRLHEDDFRILSKYGPQADANVADWPMTYADLESYYDIAEKEIGVCGKAGNLMGVKMEGGNPFEAPRKNEYPMPPLEAACISKVFDPMAKSLGYHPFPSPAGIASVQYQDLPGCNYCGFCQSYGCHIDAKRNTLITTIPIGEATGNLEIRTRCKVFRINVDDTGKATGVSYYDPAGVVQEQPASLVILGAFTYENVRLLLLSKTDKFTKGLSNSSGQVGRNLMAHIAGSALGVFDDQIINLHMGPSAPKRCIDDFGADNFDHTGLGFIRGGVITTWTSFLQGGPISFTTRLALPPGVPNWGSQYKEFIKK